MNTRTLMAAAIAAAMMTMTVSLFAAETPATGASPKSEPIYGYRMMGDDERNDYRKRMREARSEQERQAVRNDHRKLMEARAKERGATLPEPRGPRSDGPGAGYGPGSQGQDKGPGYGPGGQGKGMGPGYGPGGQGQGKGPGYGPGPRGDCPAGQECPGPGAGKGPGYGPGYGKGPGQKP